jgi:caffeoyl-CoA O-methyltransferase
VANRTISMSDQLYDYLLLSSLREPDILRRLRDETAPYPHSMMQTAPEQGQFMALLLQIIGAVNTIELGVYTGYSSLWTALALHARENHSVRHIEEWTTARRYCDGVAEG